MATPAFGSPGPPTLQLGVFSASDPAPTPAMAPAPAPAPAPTPTPLTFASVAPASVPAPVASTPVWVPTPSASGHYDAFISLNTGPFPDSSSLTTAAPQPWYVGAGVERLFGGLPTIGQAATFDQTVLQRVQQTFALAGIPLSLTANPSDPAAHTISIVSGTSNPTLGNALGMTYVGGNGFQYIDTAASSAASVDQLAWIVAHNVAHELMLAFGVPEVHDQSGRYIDARAANWSMITNPNSTFSPGAISDLLSRNFQATGGTTLGSSPQILEAPTVPEPSAVALWLALGSAGFVAARARRRLAATGD